MHFLTETIIKGVTQKRLKSIENIEATIFQKNLNSGGLGSFTITVGISEGARRTIGG